MKPKTGKLGEYTKKHSSFALCGKSSTLERTEEQRGTEFYKKLSSQAESGSWLLIMESEDLIPFHI